VEFKLNKIDTDIRRKIDEERKSSKVHSGKRINVDKDLQDEEVKHNIKEEQNEENKQKKYITIDGIRHNRKEIKVDVEKNEKIVISNSLGRILDIKK